jgi:hypothetical protein
MKSLKDVIIEKGFRISWIAIQLNITRYTLYKKINGVTEFTASEIAKLTEILHLSNLEVKSIFFKKYSDLKSHQ